MAISVEDVKKLRTITGAGILECRKSLEEAGGDFDKAVEILNKKGLVKAAKRADRAAYEGVLDLYSHGNGRVGVMVEVNCETDFVARSEVFRTFAHEIALQIAATSPQFVNQDDIPLQVLEKERENARLRALQDGKPDNIVERIVAGVIEKYLDEVCLMRQPYIRDETITVEQLLTQNIAAVGENIIIRRFVRWEVGESSPN